MSEDPDPVPDADPLRSDLAGAVAQVCGRVRSLEFQVAAVAGADPPAEALGEPPFPLGEEARGWLRRLMPFLAGIDRHLAGLGERCALLQVAQAQEVAGLSAEIEAAQAELTALRAEANRRQEVHSREVQRLRDELAAASARMQRAQDGQQREAELRRADLAEARSIAVEVERLAAADPEAVSVEHLAQPLGALREAIDGGSAEGMGAAAEEVLVGWARVVHARAASAAQELSALRWQLGERDHQREQADRDRQERRALESAMAELRRERDRAQAELLAEREACAEARRQAGESAGQLAGSRSAWAAQRAEMEALLRESRQAVLAAREALQRSASARRQVTETLHAGLDHGPR